MKLSKPQKQVLRDAIRHDGIIPRFASITTIGILRGYGLAEEGLRVTDETAILDFQFQREIRIDMAKSAMKDGDWKACLGFLQSAQDFDNQLTRTCNRITDAGRAAVAE